jgi:hypothetical protein
MVKTDDKTTNLMFQAPDTAYHYMSTAVQKIDSLFGDGYAKGHPELVCAFMQACAIDFATSMYVKSKGEI